MARKRHLASTARGFLLFLSYGKIEVLKVQKVQEVQGVQKVQKVQEVQKVLIRPIRLIRGREKGPILFFLPTATGHA